MEPFLGPVVQASDRRLANSYRFPSGARTWIHSQRLSRPQPRTRGALNGHSGRAHTPARRRTRRTGVRGPRPGPRPLRRSWTFRTSTRAQSRFQSLSSRDIPARWPTSRCSAPAPLRTRDRVVNCASARRGAPRRRREGASSSRSQSPDRAARRGTQSLFRPARRSSS